MVNVSSLTTTTTTIKRDWGQKPKNKDKFGNNHKEMSVTYPRPQVSTIEPRTGF
jgi:hypothetical protein